MPLSKVLLAIPLIALATSCTPKKVMGLGSAPPASKMEVTGGARQGAIQDVEFKKTIKLGYEAPCSIYPEIAKLLKIEGAVELNITLSDEGRPISIDVVQGPNELRSAAIEYAQNLQFDKPKQNPSTHSQATTIGIIFKLKCP